MVLSLPQSCIVKPFATILKDLPQPCWHWLTGGTFDSATGGTFQSDTDGTFHSDIPGTFESDMGGTFKVLQSLLQNKTILTLLQIRKKSLPLHPLSTKARTLRLPKPQPFSNTWIGSVAQLDRATAF